MNYELKARPCSSSSGLEGGGREASVGIGSERAAEEENEGLGLVDLVVDPASRLLDSEASPLALRKQSSSWDLLVDGLRQQHVAVLVEGVVVLLAVLDIVRVVRHRSSYSNLIF